MDGFNFTRMAWAQSWQLAVLVVAMAVLAHLFGRDRPHLAHVLWLVVLVKCVTPPLWSSPSGVFCWMGAAVAESATRQPMALSSTARLESQHQRDLPNPIDPSPAARLPSPSSLTAAGLVEQTAVEPLGDRDAKSSYERLRGSILVAVWFAGFWITGSGLILCLAAIRCLSCWRTIRAAGEEPRDDLQSLLDDLSRRLRVRRRPRLLVTRSRIGPAVIGVWRPTIVLPAAVVRDKTARDLEPILAHELLHVRRGDLWVGMLQIIAQSLWWFHPLVWLANRLIAREAERCCDEEVVGELRCEPARYARGLLDVLELKRTLQPLPAFPGVRPVEVTSQRLERIMKLGHGCRTRTPVWCWIVLVLVAALALPGGVWVTAKEKKVSQKNRPRSSSPRALPVPPGQLPDDARLRWYIDVQVISGPPRAIESLHSHWNVLPAEIPPRRAIAEISDTPVVPASYHASVSERIEKRTPVMCAVLTDDHAAALRVRLRDRTGELNIESRPQILALDGESSFISVGEERPFVVGMKENARGGTEPQVRVVTCGWMIQIRPSLKSTDEVRLDCQIERSDVRSVEERQIHGPDQLTYTIQIPEVATSRLALAHDVPIGRTLLIRGIQKTGPDFQPRSTLLVLRCLKVTGASPPAVDDAARSIEPDQVKSSVVPSPGHSRDDARNLPPLPRKVEPAGASSAIPEDRSPTPILRQPSGLPSGLDFDDKGEKTIGTGSERTFLRTYYVADLVVPLPHDVPQHVDMRRNRREPEFVGKLPTVAKADFDSLIGLITSTIQPASWVDNGGGNSIESFPTNLSLVIVQTSPSHDQIADLLEQLRRLREVQVTLESRLLGLPAFFFEEIGADIVVAEEHEVVRKLRLTVPSRP